MVKNEFMSKVLKALEKFFIKSNNFTLDGKDYALILLVSSEAFTLDQQYSLVLSASIFNELKQKELINDLLRFLKDHLREEYYNSISRVNILNTEDSLVRNLRLISAYPGNLMEVNDFRIGGVLINNGIVLKSNLLNKLVSRLSVDITISGKDHIPTFLKVNIFSINEEFNLHLLNQQGIRFFNDRLLENVVDNVNDVTQEFLIANGLLETVNLDAIIDVQLPM